MLFSFILVYWFTPFHCLAIASSFLLLLGISLWVREARYIAYLATDDAVLQKAFESGGTDYVRKPINRAELLARIKSVFTQKMLMERIVEQEKLQGALEMAGAVCHEMNQPLQAVTWATELLRKEVTSEAVSIPQPWTSFATSRRSAG